MIDSHELGMGSPQRLREEIRRGALVLEGWMTFRTPHLLVLTQQWERAVMIMIEAGRRLPALLGMAVAAELSDLGTMLVEVAIAAGRGQSKEGLAIGLPVDTLDDGLVDHPPGLVAIAAALRSVLPAQRPSGSPVIEALHSSASPIDGGEVEALVLVVTRPAGVELGLGHRPMEAFAGLGAIADLRMTSQAAAGGQLPTLGMTALTFVDPLQRGVGARQVARREHVGAQGERPVQTEKQCAHHAET
jgi:hypothetical protein